MVYFFEGVNELSEPMVKIGFTDGETPEQRLKACQTGSPVKLKIIGFIPAGRRNTEAMLHRRFRKHRSHGEWFYLEPIRHEIERLAQLATSN